MDSAFLQSPPLTSQAFPSCCLCACSTHLNVSSPSCLSLPVEDKLLKDTAIQLARVRHMLFTVCLFTG